jgi:hypothetical protein
MAKSLNIPDYSDLKNRLVNGFFVITRLSARMIVAACSDSANAALREIKKFSHLNEDLDCVEICLIHT